MAAPTLWYVNGLKTVMSAGLGITSVTGTLKLVLLTDAYVLDQDAHDFYDDISTDEATGGGSTGYTTGGLTLASTAVSLDATTNTVSFDAADITGLNLSACYAVVIVSTGTDSTSPVYTITDLSEGTGVNVTVTGITWSASGIAALTAA